MNLAINIVAVAALLIGQSVILSLAYADARLTFARRKR